MTDVHWIGYRLACKVALALIALIVVVGFSQSGILDTVISVACLAVPATLIVVHGRMPAALAFIFVTAALLSAAGWAWNLYQRIPHFDGIVHVLSTLAMTLFVAFYFYGEFLQVYRGHSLLLAITLISIGVAIGATWEVIEYFLIPAAKMGFYDTITDLIADFLGATLSVPLVHWARMDRITSDRANRA